MIESIDFIHYRKIKDIKLQFAKGINAISGENGTCKSSILHIIGNSYQKVKQSNSSVDTKSFNIIKKINQTVNPKIESLTRGDKEYNDPADGVKGKLYTVNYDDTSCDFRRHNATNEGDSSRYRLIPLYPRGKTEALKERVVIYLGLTRIIPVGELGDLTQTITSNLPEKYQDELIQEYKKLTNISIDSITTEKSNNVKIRSDFTSKDKGIDSNTISAGEDNLFIILTALICLKWLFEETKPDSTLLIDEIDATLHPSIQVKLFELILRYSNEYNIQVFFTTHSLYLLEKIFKRKQNVIYLTNNPGNTVRMIENPDIYRIEMFLKSETREEALSDKKIPIFTEDEEARILLEEIFDDLSERDSGFVKVRHYFHFVKINLGSDSLRDLFNDRFLKKTTLKAICILDGDKTDKKEDGRILSLPEYGSPEQIVFKHLVNLYNDPKISENFWNQETVEMAGYNLTWLVHHNVIIDVNALITKYDRVKAKAFFKKHSTLFILVFKHWLLTNRHDHLYKRFIKNLNTAFKATATENGINSSIWNID